VFADGRGVVVDDPPCGWAVGLDVGCEVEPATGQHASLRVTSVDVDGRAAAVGPSVHVVPAVGGGRFLAERDSNEPPRGRRGADGFARWGQGIDVLVGRCRQVRQRYGQLFGLGGYAACGDRFLDTSWLEYRPGTSFP
jgi:hypothetical protein